MKANHSGQFAEDVLAAVLTGAGCVFDRQVVIGETIYGGDYRADFLIRNLANYPRGLALESKWQTREGSVDEKFPFLLATIERCSVPAVVVVHGGGCRLGALAWLQARCNDEHLVAVFPLEGFMAWLLQQPR